MPLCKVHRRHTVVRLCVRRSASQMCISMTSELEVLKIGPYAKYNILVSLNLLKC